MKKCLKHFAEVCVQFSFIKAGYKGLDVDIKSRIISRRSHPDVLCKKSILKNFTKFTGKHPGWSLFFSKVPSWRPATLLKKRLQYKCFPVNFAKFSRAAFL